jgi:hypothetical protein
MDAEPEGRAGRTDGPALFGTGSLASGGPDRTRHRGRTVAVTLLGAALLAGGVLVHGVGGHQDRPLPQVMPATGSAAPESAVPGPRGIQVTGRRGFDIASGSGAASIVLGAVERVPTLAAGSALELQLRFDVWAGMQSLTTDSFSAADSGGGTPTRASGLTILDPGAHVMRSDGGFRIASPSSVDVQVILNVPPGDYVVSVLGDSADQILASFSVRG